MKFPFRSRKGHGIHSPFVFNLVTKVIEETAPFYAFEEIENFRTELLARGDTLSKITAKEAQPPNYGKLLFRIVHYFKCRNILEIGASTGITSLYLALARHLPITGAGTEAGSDLCRTNTFDLIVIHRLPAGTTAAQLLEQLRPTIGENTLIVVDSIYKQPEMKHLWQLLQQGGSSPCQNLCQSPSQDPSQRLCQSTITLDLKHLGMVFFNQSLPKKQYKIYFNGKK
ncbi:hypothetical protein [Candidatus Symbiothrix dinenymphae]|uniref:hypothetical protein n=1 Tax=Candidatus Symbiothrix dinenymphae TaxID=467085 RepID=UPI0006BF9BB5|nr:hypothetical protein [Candidatus Symbiothrix dinenymphae]GAP72207.1 hypothetical protein SAMD00024442_27_17 [Candidatus Symbiothrix dinenymphae]